MANSYQIAVLGDKDSVLGFKALGLTVFPVDDVEQARHTLHRIAKEEYAVILLPGKEGSLGMGIANIKKSVERAVGADIL